jgi:hypothetical protein
MTLHAPYCALCRPSMSSTWCILRFASPQRQKKKVWGLFFLYSYSENKNGIDLYESCGPPLRVHRQQFDQLGRFSISRLLKLRTIPHDASNQSSIKIARIVRLLFKYVAICAFTIFIVQRRWMFGMSIQAFPFSGEFLRASWNLRPAVDQNICLIRRIGCYHDLFLIFIVIDREMKLLHCVVASQSVQDAQGPFRPCWKMAGMQDSEAMNLPPLAMYFPLQDTVKGTLHAPWYHWR